MDGETEKTTARSAAAAAAVRVCVTGAGGFAASWLVKLLLSKADSRYIVHGTVRDPGDEKNAHLIRLDGAATKLRLFKADLLDYDSLVKAVAGCEGVFHVACPVPSTKVPKPEADMLSPAITGTLNLLKVCSEVKVKRVVVVSSVAAVCMNPKISKHSVQDEDFWSDEEYCKSTENWYCLAKTVAERRTFEYAEQCGLNVVTICPSLILGPLLQSVMVNASSLVLINYLKGVQETIENKFRYIVDVRDLASAMLLLYENSEATGRYICTSHIIKADELINLLKGMYPSYNYPKNFVEGDEHQTFSSEKLEKLGWSSRPLEETLRDSVESYRMAGLLSNKCR